MELFAGPADVKTCNPSKLRVRLCSGRVLILARNHPNLSFPQWILLRGLLHRVHL